MIVLLHVTAVTKHSKEGVIWFIIPGYTVSLRGNQGRNLSGMSNLLSAGFPHHHHKGLPLPPLKLLPFFCSCGYHAQPSAAPLSNTTHEAERESEACVRLM